MRDFFSPKSALLLTCALLVFCFPLSTTAQAENETIRTLLIPDLETIFSSELAASIQELSVDFGDHFSQGQKLIVFDCRMYASELKKSEAALLEATQTLETNSRLNQLKSVSELDVAISKARVERAKAEMELSQSMVSKCSVNAPFSGRVLSRSANLFQYVTPGQPLLQVIDDRNLSLQLFVPSEWLSHLKTGQTFPLTIDETKKKYKATITLFGAKVDQVSQTIEVRAKIVGDHPELLAGMSGTASFTIH